jgi:hypothetical protein
MGANDLQIQVWQRKLACVIEPSLALALPAGPALALGLAHAFEAWLTRSFWQVLDASELLAGSRSTEADTIEPDARALASWMAMRDSTDAGSWTLRWLGDNFAESQLRETAQIDLIERYESLLETLLARLAQARACSDSPGAPWRTHLDRTLAAADALALSACLNGALVLCAGQSSEQPVPINALALAGVPTTAPEGIDESGVLAAERALVRQALAAAGLAPLMQTLPRLAAVHVLVSDENSDDARGPWACAQAWWYWI